MFCFRIPTTILKDIERLCANFWWGDSDEGRKIHWKAWQQLQEPKSKGGLGFRGLIAFNKLFLAKQVWRIMRNPDNLVSKILKARYFRHYDIMEATTGNNPSFIWRFLLWSRDVMATCLFWKVGNGEKTLGEDDI